MDTEHFLATEHLGLGIWGISFYVIFLGRGILGDWVYFEKTVAFFEYGEFSRVAVYFRMGNFFSEDGEFWSMDY